jgi:hypothetical protein
MHFTNCVNGEVPNTACHVAMLLRHVWLLTFDFGSTTRVRGMLSCIKAWTFSLTCELLSGIADLVDRHPDQRPCR